MDQREKPRKGNFLENENTTQQKLWGTLTRVPQKKFLPVSDALKHQKECK